MTLISSTTRRKPDCCSGSLTDSVGFLILKSQNTLLVLLITAINFYMQKKISKLNSLLSNGLESTVYLLAFLQASS